MNPQDSPYIISMNCYHAGSMAQGGKTIHEGTVKEYTDRIEAYVTTRVKEAERAFGGCKNCYGKGYATVKSQILGHGTDGDIGGFEGKLKIDTPVHIKYCECGRGKQLEALTTTTNGKGHK